MWINWWNLDLLRAKVKYFEMPFKRICEGIYNCKTDRIVLEEIIVPHLICTLRIKSYNTGKAHEQWLTTACTCWMVVVKVILLAFKFVESWEIFIWNCNQLKKHFFTTYSLPILYKVLEIERWTRWFLSPICHGKVIINN